MKHLYHSRLSQSSYDAIVIGSGIGGLATAVFLAKSGKKVLVLEKHYVPGGLTHTFRRKKFVWDVGVHYVGQVHKENGMLRKMFDYLTNNQLKWSYMGEVYDKAVIEGDTYEFHAGIEKQIESLEANFPDEKKAIRQYFTMIKKASASSMLFFGERTMPSWLSKTVGPFMRKSFTRYSAKTTLEVLHELTRNQKLIAVLCAQCGNYGLPPSRSSFAIHAMIVDHFLDGGNYPVGGASSIHKSLTSVLENNGGTLAVKAAVKKIVIENNTAVGVEMENGEIIKAKKIISNAGAHNTYFRLLGNHHLKDPMLSALESVKPSISHVCLYVGLNKSDKELNLPKHNIWGYDNYEFDKHFESHIKRNPGESPLVYISFPSAKDTDWPLNNPGIATIQVVGSFPYNSMKEWELYPWQQRGEKYEALKEKIKEYLLKKLLLHVPSIEYSIEYLELSTPLSTRHFTNYASGEIYGLEHTPERFRLTHLRPKTKIKNLYITGQDVVCVGVGGALFSGLVTAVAVLNRNLMWRVLRYKNSGI